MSGNGRRTGTPATRPRLTRAAPSPAAATMSRAPTRGTRPASRAGSWRAARTCVPRTIAAATAPPHGWPSRSTLRPAPSDPAWCSGGRALRCSRAPSGMPAIRGERPRGLRSAGAVRFTLCVSDGPVGEEGDAALDGPGVEEAHGFLVASLAEQALPGPEHDREDLQPQLVDEVVLHQRVYELEAGGDDDLPVQLLLQLRDLVRHVAPEHRRVVPDGMFEGR